MQWHEPCSTTPGLLPARDQFYFELESFLDNWRRQGVPEEVVRAAIERAKRASLAVEHLGERLKYG